MSEQPDLFGAPRSPVIRTPASRADDPETSRLAEARINARGLREAHRDLILAFLRHHPGSTVGEIARGVGLERAAVSKRMCEGETAKQWRRSETHRACTVQGTRQLMWYPTEGC